MSIKEHHLYPLFIEFLKKKRMSKGAFELNKISEEAFFDFKYRFDTNMLFRERQENFYKSIVRENKIDNIINDKTN